MTPARNERQKPSTEVSKNPSPLGSPRASFNAPPTASCTSTHAGTAIVAVTPSPPSGAERGIACRCSCDCEEAVEEGFVDRDELRYVGDRDALIGFVHRLADQAEFGDRAIGLDKARIGGATGRAELGGTAGHGGDRLRQAIADLAGRHEEGLSADRPFEMIIAAGHREPLCDPFLQLVAGPQIVEADVESGARRAWYDVCRRIADIDCRDLQSGALKMLRTGIERHRGQRVQ